MAFARVRPTTTLLGRRSPASRMRAMFFAVALHLCAMFFAMACPQAPRLPPRQAGTGGTHANSLSTALCWHKQPAVGPVPLSLRLAHPCAARHRLLFRPDGFPLSR